MIPINFPEANARFGPPPDLDNSQCMTIHAYSGVVHGGNLDGSPIVITAWKPTREELEQLNAGGAVYLSVLGGLPAHMLTASFEAAQKV